MVLNLSFRKFWHPSEIDPIPPLPPPLGPKPEGQSYEKKVGPEGIKNRRSVVQRLKNGQKMCNDLAITLSWGTFSYLDL